MTTAVAEPVEPGSVFGRLTVKEQAPRKPGKKSGWVCVCTCGREKTFTKANLQAGRSRSCGCLRSEQLAARSRTHGMGASTEFNIWANMKTRCRNKNANGFKNYGARGISVCEQWESSFENFLADMGRRPSAKHSLDRINNDGNYEPSNCRWVTQDVQARNMRSNVACVIDGERITMTDASRRFGIPVPTISSRIKSGWEPTKAFTTPSKG